MCEKIKRHKLAYVAQKLKNVRERSSEDERRVTIEGKEDEEHDTTEA